jgi:hypothetical protein
VVLSDGPASYWKLNETKLNETSGTTATDRTGANNGTYTIGPTLTIDHRGALMNG